MKCWHQKIKQVQRKLYVKHVRCRNKRYTRLFSKAEQLLFANLLLIVDWLANTVSQSM